MTLTFHQPDCNDFASAIHKEWLITNGIGGYASSTLSGANNEKSLAVLRAAERDLLTPYGLRTLAPSDPRYRARYEGDVWSRDSAYHQGTVWPWLAGPFFTAKIRYSSDRAQAIAETEAWLEGFSVHFEDAGLGQISEIFDADEPHNPRGCVAQAWSVDKLLGLARLVAQFSPEGTSVGVEQEPAEAASD